MTFPSHPPIIHSLEEQNTLLRDDSILQFRAMHSRGNASLPHIMESLTPMITPEQFEQWCEAFAQGLDYVRTRDGVQPSLITFTNDDKAAPITYHETYSIHIPRSFVAGCFDATKGIKNTDIAPFVLSPMDDALIAGIESAYHVVMARTHPEYAANLKNPDVPSEQKNEIQHMMDEASRAVIREAMRDLGITQRAAYDMATNLQPNDIAWAIPELKQRTESPATTITQPQHSRVAEVAVAAGKSVG